MINWQYYPKSNAPTDMVHTVVRVFEEATSIDSSRHNDPSNVVLASLESGLITAGFEVETGKKKAEKINVPVLYGLNGKIEKSFDADAYHRTEGFVLEVEAGRGRVNNQFLKDLFQACMMHEVYYLGIALRNDYRGTNDFEAICRFFDTLYASDRLILPLKGIVIIGY